MRVVEHLVTAIRRAGRHNPDVQVAPACILWPDRDRQWEAVIPRLQSELPELLVLGEYAPERHTGPAIWLRCVLAGTVDDVALPGDRVPILYLPGVGRADLRAVEECPDRLKPLAELQYRGVIWSQVNAKDWTVLAFLKSDQGGLGLDVAQNQETKSALLLALPLLLDEEVERLRGKRLDADDLNTLLTGGDPIRDLLRWLDQGDEFQAGCDEAKWKALVSVCRSQLGFDPQNEGVLAGSAKLAARQGPWQAVWERFCEAPRRYPNLPDRIRQCKPPAFDLFANCDTAGGWPQWNETQEQSLRGSLTLLERLPPHGARKRLRELERRHGERRSLVWAELGETPLACSLEHLAALAEHTESALAGGTAEDLVAAFRTGGWKADDAAVQALACATAAQDREAVTAAIRAVYAPWLEDSARYLQQVAARDGYPGGDFRSCGPVGGEDGDCVLFVDGLRFDLARRLAALLERAGLAVDEEPFWAALPTVTATGKPAVSPVADRIRGAEGTADFEPVVDETGQSLKGGYHLRRLLTEAGWTVLGPGENGDGRGRAWCEFGDIDHEGHDKGWKMVRHLDGLLGEVREKVEGLLASGWRRVRVVTDHGWLLLPGGLPKTELASGLTEHKWGRCASLKPGASTDERLYPWHWDPTQHVALADGIGCYRTGLEYAHGGLSLQECCLLRLTVSAGAGGGASAAVEVTDVVWKGLRCKVAVDGEFAGLRLDVRTHAGDPGASVALSIKPIGEHGTASVVVEDEALEGRQAFVVLLDERGCLIAQVPTVIGGEAR